MSWLSKLFFGDRDVVEPLVEKTGYDATVVTPIDIMEPVYSFVRCVIENPQRFQLRKLKRLGGMNMSRSEFMFTDRVTFESWTVTLDYRTRYLIRGVKLDWLTEDESRFITKSLADMYNARRDKLCILRNHRNRRKTQTERERLIGVYCVPKES